MASSSTNKVLLSKERKCNPTPDIHLNMVPPGINILMKKPRDLYFVAFLDFLYPILNISFGQCAKAPLPFDLILCKILTIPMVLCFF